LLIGSDRYQRDSATGLLIALFLTWIAGFVDAVGFLAFANIYTANMSGNSVAIGITAAERDWPRFALRLWPVAIYFAGLLCGRTLIEIGARERIRRIASVGFTIEIGLLLACIFVAHVRWLYPGIGLLALAMGIQNATLTHFSSLTLNTGFVTGTMVKCAEQFVGYGTWLFDELRKGQAIGRTLARSPEQPAFRIGVFLAFAWIMYVIGALVGAFGKAIAGGTSLLVPIAGLLIMSGVDLFRPLAIREEQQQEKHV
jgi:uncharacterized membrane protein YoaK (UPF0700 family)